jgi:hypothetical protein
MICRSGARSLRAAQFLRQVGFEQVINVQGGTLAWRAAGKALAFGEHSAGTPRIIESTWAHALSLGGFSSSGLLRGMSRELGLLLSASRRRPRPWFGHEAAQEQTLAWDQGGDKSQDATGKASQLLTDRLASTWPPRLTTRHVATAMAHHNRSARCASRASHVHRQRLFF